MSATASHGMPDGLESHHLRRRLLQIGALVVVVAAVVALVPGFAGVRENLARASPGWLVLAASVEILSCLPTSSRFAPRSAPG